MAVLQFGFGDGGGGREHEPHNYVRKLLAYTGTHDNDTFVGWFRSKPSRNASRKEAQVLERVRTRVRTYLGGNPKDIHWQAVRALLVSVADTTIFPLQDLLGLGSEARMNVPGIATGNWTFRADEQQLEPAIAERMRALCEVSRRITNSSTDHRTRNSRKPA
jgi:4-alpha-glucanotransferase